MKRYTFQVWECEGSIDDITRLRLREKIENLDTVDAFDNLNDFELQRKKSGAEVVEIDEETLAIINDSDRVSMVAEIISQ